MRFSPFLSTTTLLALVVGFSGCDTKKPDASTKPEAAAAATQPDDADSVSALKKAGAGLKLNKAGSSVEVVDMQTAGGGNVELFKAAAKLPALRAIICTGPDVTDEAVAALKGHARLEKLSATDRSAIGDAGIEALTSVPNLMDLTLERSAIDRLHTIKWDLQEFAGQPVRFECVDGDDGNAYAWLAVTNFSFAGLNPSSVEGGVTRLAKLIDQF